MSGSHAVVQCGASGACGGVGGALTRAVRAVGLFFRRLMNGGADCAPGMRAAACGGGGGGCVWLEALEPRLFLAADSALDEAARAVAARAVTARTINFADVEWYVKSSDEQVGPGPNYFSDSTESVWVDANGWLHLKVRKDGSRWYCAEVYTTQVTRYGVHRFYVDGAVGQLDKNVVLGLFAYATDTKEIDVEFSRWGDSMAAYNSQFVIQPYYHAGNREQFVTQLDGALSTCYFDWQPGSAQLKSFKGHSEEPESAGDLIHGWTYSGADVPTPLDGLTVRMNLWLYQGAAPSSQQDIEVVIRDVDIPIQPNASAPVIAGLKATPVQVRDGDTLRVGAYDVCDADGSVTRVEFYRDVNGNRSGEAEELLGADTDGSDGWSWSGSANWGTGTHGLLARARDDDGNWGAWTAEAVDVWNSDNVVVLGEGEGAEAKSVTFFDESNSVVTVSFRGGIAPVFFGGGVSKVPDPKHKSVFAGYGLRIAGIGLCGTTRKSSLTFSVKGGLDKLTAVGAIGGTAPFGKVSGSAVDLVGTGVRMEGAGYIESLTLHDVLKGAEVLLEGSAGKAMAFSVQKVSDSSVINVVHGPVRSAKFSGQYRGVFAAGISAGPDGCWFTTDDAVVERVRVDSVTFAKKVGGDATQGAAYGVLLGPGAGSVSTGLAGTASRANQGACADGFGFDAQVLCGPNAAIEIESVRGNAWSRSVAGSVVDISRVYYDVLLYAKTDLWYIQPFLNRRLGISSKSRWSTSSVKPGELWAWVVRKDVQLPNIMSVAPTVDGRRVVCEDMWEF